MQIKMQCERQAFFMPAFRALCEIWKTCKRCGLLGAPVWLPNLPETDHAPQMKHIAHSSLTGPPAMVKTLLSAARPQLPVVPQCSRSKPR